MSLYEDDLYEDDLYKDDANDRVIETANEEVTEQVAEEIDLDSIDSDSERNSLLAASLSRSSYMSSRSDMDESIEAGSTAAQAAKAIEAAAQSTSTPARQSRSSSPAASTVSRPESEAVSLLRDAGPAPPDYAQATAWRLSFHRTQPETTQPSWNDESSVAVASPSFETQKKGGWKGMFSRHWKMFCLVNLAIYCIIITVVLIVRAVSLPKEEAEIMLDEFPLDHPLGKSHDLKQFHPDTPECQFSSIWQLDEMWWGEPIFEFSIAETAPPFAEIDFGKISGNVQVRKAPFGQVQDVAVFTNVATTKDWSAETSVVDFLEPGPGLKIDYAQVMQETSHVNPDHADLKRRGGNHGACLDVWIGVYVKRPLDNFQIRTENLHVSVGSTREHEHWYGNLRTGPNIPLVRNSTAIFSKKGDVNVTLLDSRRTRIATESGSIVGQFTLNDRVDIETKSGNMNVSVLHAADNRYSSPQRSRHVPANLSTISDSGNQDILLRQIIFRAELDPPYRHLLDSYHSSKSGFVNLSSGNLWQGTLTAESISGSIDLRGDELDVTPGLDDGRTFGRSSKFVQARKGTANSTMKIETAGDISVCVSEECGKPWDPNFELIGYG